MAAAFALPYYKIIIGSDTSHITHRQRGVRQWTLTVTLYDTAHRGVACHAASPSELSPRSHTQSEEVPCRVCGVQ